MASPQAAAVLDVLPVRLRSSLAFGLAKTPVSVGFSGFCGGSATSLRSFGGSAALGWLGGATSLRLFGGGRGVGLVCGATSLRSFSGSAALGWLGGATSLRSFGGSAALGWLGGQLRFACCKKKEAGPLSLNGGRLLSESGLFGVGASERSLQTGRSTDQPTRVSLSLLR